MGWGDGVYDYMCLCRVECTGLLRCERKDITYILLNICVFARSDNDAHKLLTKDESYSLETLLGWEAIQDIEVSLYTIVYIYN